MPNCHERLNACVELHTLRLVEWKCWVKLEVVEFESITSCSHQRKPRCEVSTGVWSSMYWIFSTKDAQIELTTNIAKGVNFS